MKSRASAKSPAREIATIKRLEMRLQLRLTRVRREHPDVSFESSHARVHDHVENDQLNRLTGEQIQSSLTAAGRENLVAGFGQHALGQFALLDHIVHHQDRFALPGKLFHRDNALPLDGE